MTLHVVYRSHGGENRKGRPDWYSKQLALLSLARAASLLSAEAQLHFVKEGRCQPTGWPSCNASEKSCRSTSAVAGRPISGCLRSRPTERGRGRTWYYSSKRII